MSSCSFDEKYFRLCCKLFLKHSNSLGDGWSWEQLQHSEEGYLKKTSVRCVTITINNAAKDLDPEQEEPQPTAEDEVSARDESSVDTMEVKNDDIEDDEACVQSNVGGTVLQYEYHVLFSCSFGMPVLYFRVFDLEGKSLCLEQVWDTVHPNYRMRLQQNPWNTITQQEHPMLGQPFFVLHPCKTEEFMWPVVQAAEAEHRKVNYVVTWLSVVGPLVGLDLPLSYSTLLHAVNEQSSCLSVPTYLL
ncbi:Ubiquitin-like-conjugating enzyme ATG10 [Merluccius polli]|uniref:Ubiquitin-like-conjugating enzyme ATG10 n=1 Tax=Merluccius polli TaxID=89951 RepID=A0AA47MAV3_MERPO|nr:Ubiquitin-like-conjugating enzyme ATG10 [Merluccius polli]